MVAIGSSGAADVEEKNQLKKVNFPLRSPKATLDPEQQQLPL
jgi:hypothetical protein